MKFARGDVCLSEKTHYDNGASCGWFPTASAVKSAAAVQGIGIIPFLPADVSGQESAAAPMRPLGVSDGEGFNSGGED